MAATQESSEKAEHITALNKVNEDVASLLQIAGSALNALTTPPPDLDSSSDPLEARKVAYLAEATSFFTVFARIRDGLAAEADALETAKLIPANPPKTLRDDEQGLTNGGLGKFDVGWLNSRGDAVMREKERELWAEAREVLEKAERQSPEERKKDDNAHDMAEMTDD